MLARYFYRNALTKNKENIMFLLILGLICASGIFAAMMSPKWDD
ncbi:MULTISPECIES: protein MgtS [Arsenophonus]